MIDFLLFYSSPVFGAVGEWSAAKQKPAGAMERKFYTNAARYCGKDLMITDQDPQQLQAFQHLAHEREQHAGKLEAAARGRDAQQLRTRISEVLAYCLACHQHFGDQATQQR